MCELYEIIDVEAGLTPMDNKCVRQKDIFVGGCGRDGNEMCINDFVQKGNDWPSSCECDNLHDKHVCRCIMPGKDIFAGACSPDGNKMCINEVVKKRGEENRPSSCDCDNYTDQHLCTCDFDC